MDQGLFYPFERVAITARQRFANASWGAALAGSQACDFELGLVSLLSQSCQRLFPLLLFSFLVAIMTLAIITASTNSTSTTNTISAIISTSTAGITYRMNYPLPCFATGISARQAGPILGSLGRDGVSFWARWRLILGNLGLNGVSF